MRQNWGQGDGEATHDDTNKQDKKKTIKKFLKMLWKKKTNIINSTAFSCKQEEEEGKMKNTRLLQLINIEMV